MARAHDAYAPTGARFVVLAGALLAVLGHPRTASLLTSGREPPSSLRVTGRRAVLAAAALALPASAIETGVVQRDMSKSASRETRLGYKDDLGVKSYSAVQRAWESSAGKSSTEIMMQARGAAPRDPNAPPESERSRKRRAMAGCHEEAYRKRTAYDTESEAQCNSRVLGGEVQFMLDALDAQ